LNFALTQKIKKKLSPKFSSCFGFQVRACLFGKVLKRHFRRRKGTNNDVSVTRQLFAAFLTNHCDCRVARLVEFSPNVRLLLLWAVFLENDRSFPHFCQLYSTVKFIYLTYKNGLATFWSIFSQTHLVTLMVCQPHLLRKDHFSYSAFLIVDNEGIFFFKETEKSKLGSRAGLPDFSCHNIPKRGKIYHIATKLPKGHLNMHQKAIIHSK
jgi:hypothetical protein